MRRNGPPCPSVPAGRLLPFARPGSFSGVRLIVPDVQMLVLPDGVFPMAKKNFSPKPARPKPAPRTARPVTVMPARAAHPRLIHGFLVRLVARSTIPAAEAKPAFVAVPSVKARAKSPSDAKREGPADDATFH